MKLTPVDLQNYSRLMASKTDWKYAIIPIKSEDTGYRWLYLENTETWERDFLNGLMNLRESYEYLRAFYKWVNISKKLNQDDIISPDEKFIIQSNVDYVAWILDYYEGEFKEYLDDDKREEMDSDFSECYDKLSEIWEIISKEKEQS